MQNASEICIYFCFAIFGFSFIDLGGDGQGGFVTW